MGMKRKREAGKFVPETEEEKTARRLTGDAEAEPEPDAGAKRVGRKPSLQASRLRYCRKLVSHKVAEAMPSIVDALVAEARKGSVEHTKEFLKLASAEQGRIVVEAPKRRGKGFAQRLLEELRKAPVKTNPTPIEEIGVLASE